MLHRNQIQSLTTTGCISICVHFLLLTHLYCLKVSDTVIRKSLSQKSVVSCKFVAEITKKQWYANLWMVVM
jgi:hypothetical protein